MSDLDEEHTRREDDDENAIFEDDDDEPEERPKKKKHSKHSDEEEDDEEDEDGDDDDEDEEDEDEDEDPGESRGKKRRKRQKKPSVNRFLDLVADVDDEEDDDEDEEDEDVRDGFLEETGQEGDDLGNMNQNAASHARLNRKQQELTDQDLARIAQDVTDRYRPVVQPYSGDMNEIPQRLLMPSVQDANLWQVRVRPGKEREIVFSLMRKALDQANSAKPLQIFSAFERESLPGIVYVEARSSQQVIHAINGLVGVFINRGTSLVPIEEMASLLQIKKREVAINPGSWVRIKRGKYIGDLAQVIDLSDNGEEVGLKLMPRIDLNPKDEIVSTDGKKRKLKGTGMTATNRPPQRFFNFEEVVKAYGRRAVGKRNHAFVFNNETFRDGYLEKDFKLSALQLENVNPTLDEIMKFTRQEDGLENDTGVDLTIIAETAKKEAIQVLQPGDHVEVFEGEQTGVHGVVESIANDVVTLKASGIDMEGQKVDVPARSVRKRFKPGDHVKVMSGQNADETGLVVSVVDNVVTFLSDMSMQEVSVFSRDLREAAEVGSGSNIVGNYELHDLVQIDLQTVGVIFKTERDSFRVLDQNGQVRLVQPHQISMRKDPRGAIATDSEGHELKVGDNVKEIDGEERKGIVLHTYQSFFAFLFNREISENGGVFVTRARSLKSVAPKGNAEKAKLDLTKMNPAVAGNVQSQSMVNAQVGRGPRDRMIGVICKIIKGPQKGYNGIIKDTNGNQLRIELQANNKIITIDRAKVLRMLPTGKLENLEPPRARNTGSFEARNGGSMLPPGDGRWGLPPTANPYNNGNKTPAWPGSGFKTPNPYVNDSGSRTPFGDGGKTPTWGMGQAAPRTPAWGAGAGAGSRTPAWNAAAPGSTWNAPKTPGWSGAGAQTPAWPGPARTPNPYQNGQEGASEATGPWGGVGSATPAWVSSWGDAASAPTPAFHLPAMTPAASAPTPAASSSFDRDYYNYGTPAASAQTPSAGFEYKSPEDTDDGQHFLLRPELKPLHKSLIVTFLGTATPGREWFEGKYENRDALVVTVLALQNKVKTSTVLVKLLPDKDVTLTVPMVHVYPYKPKVNDLCVPCKGRWKGQKMKLMSLAVGNRAICESEHGIHEEQIENLCGLEK